MVQKSLSGLSVLVVEDEYAVAEFVSQELIDAGAHIVGPAGTLVDAHRYLDSEQVDVGLLDVNLRGEMIFPFLQALDQRSIPYALVTGYDDSTIPKAHLDTPRLMKPVEMEHVVSTLLTLTGREGTGRV